MGESKAKELLRIGEMATQGFANGLKATGANAAKMTEWLDSFPDLILTMAAEEMNVPVEVLRKIRTDEDTVLDRWLEAMRGR